MKNFDIDHLERKNIYKIPDGFFEDMQSKVLQQTTPEKSDKIFKINWAYASAAAIVLLFGITFMLNQPTEVAITKQQIAKVDLDAVKNTISSDKPKNEALIAYQTLQEDLTSVEQEHLKKNRSESETNKQIRNANPVKNQNTDVQMDQVLSNFTTAELADLGNNAEQDIYLDLYN